VASLSAAAVSVSKSVRRGFFRFSATAWIPQLVVLGIWRYFIKRYPFRYTPMDWGMVFPLGMYTVCTYMPAKAVSIPWLEVIPSFFVYFVLAAWFVTTFYFLRSWAGR
jgi:tellurite resistance protein TehA-like permease